jgi:excisionase family DNA binding protein
MPWIRVCDGFDTDRRIEEVGLDATGLFTRSVSYSSRYLLEGRVEAKWVERRVRNAKRRQRLVGELVEAGLWREVEGGWEIVPLLDDADALVHHPSKAEAEEYRRKEAQKKRAQRARRQAQSSDVAGSVPQGQRGDSPVRPWSGIGQEGAGREMGSENNASDPWALTDEERLDEGEAGAEHARLRQKFPEMFPMRQAARPARPPRAERPTEYTSAEVAFPPEFIEAVAARVAVILAERPTAPEPWVGVEDAAGHLACPRSRIYALVSAGRIPHRKDGARVVFRCSELDEWLEQGGGKRP